MAVKASLLAAGYSHPDRLFPEYFQAPDAEKAEEEAIARGDDVVLDFSEVEFEMPSGEEDMEETLRLMQAMGANLSLSVGEEEQWSPTPAPGEDHLPTQVVDDDREWL